MATKKGGSKKSGSKKGGKKAGSKKSGSKKGASKKSSSKRELIDTGTDKRYVRRDKKGRIKESDDVGRSLAQDVKKKAKTKVKSGQGDRGDQ
ncbi:MAG: hypothetical protein QOE33_1149 [Acidobacteriota bacterium]|nr:hypothetical protein [Acidobacteriota bacterium]